MRADSLLLEGLTVSLGGRPVLDGIDLAVAPGETVGLIGPNGAGKTTLLRAVLGLVKPDAGAVVAGLGRPGYVPQKHEFTWDFPITVAGAVRNARSGGRRPGRSLTGGLRRRAARNRADREAAAEALDRVGLADLAGRPVGELSGGQRQRVLVARALARRPSLLLLDEPFTGVDVPTQELLTALLARLAQEGTAVLMTTHDLAQARATCSRLCLLNRTVIADGPPESLSDPDLWLRAFGVAASGELKALLAGTEAAA
ncbi:anchored repeat-type ABC transporter ATP-binding subunit [Glycomyces sp. TRM65418]|uniref:anchored repeat-type ABC transporter ATP-binding subunit n=1 Tax=Glycomyces sp. TRM65418 TaxID=2867006 RepID=UPI001CE715C9|nr:anchored repeat-type ABC transporter ATP-binding subunit [Glycomyces sp. TRM65418]MCC3763117.1 anchored repeat-type ABC transporter ATP-binding subunit [Glycomyces sp. TRM65418]QZD57125.1 anchored repeat-type ABC transporter ATP-binding subunit [Glycomyces sp. TRM65418]